MALHVSKTEHSRVYTDEKSGRSFSEFKCAGCGEWFAEDEIFWATPLGTLTMRHKDSVAWCEACLPDNPDDTGTGASLT